MNTHSFLIHIYTYENQRICNAINAVRLWGQGKYSLININIYIVLSHLITYVLLSLWILYVGEMAINQVIWDICIFVANTDLYEHSMLLFNLQHLNIWKAITHKKLGISIPDQTANQLLFGDVNPFLS